MLNNSRPLRRHRRMGLRIARQDSSWRGIDRRMRHYLRPGKLLRFDRHQIPMYQLGIAKCICRNCSCGGRLIAVVNVIDVVYVRDVGDVDISHISDVDLTQVDIAVVVPGKERFAGTEWKPPHHATNSEAHGKSCTA
jgi:hypothetical protein